MDSTPLAQVAKNTQRKVGHDPSISDPENQRTVLSRLKDRMTLWQLQPTRRGHSF